jgi:hypothetical protein
VRGTRTYGEARLKEMELAQKHKTIIGRKGDDYRGNRQKPMDDKRMAEYQEYMRKKKNPGGGCG